jgi:hypothetical protein
LENRTLTSLFDQLVNELQSLYDILGTIEGESSKLVDEILHEVDNEFKKQCPRVSRHIEQGFHQALSNVSKKACSALKGKRLDDDVPF